MTVAVVQGPRCDEACGPDTALEVVTLPGWARLPDAHRRLLTLLEEITAADDPAPDRLHHVEWRLTGDPEVVARLLDSHSCTVCLSGLDQTQAWLAEHPGWEVAVGYWFWAGKE